MSLQQKNIAKMQRRLLVLGASRYQLPAIQSAKARGLYVITADNIASNPGHLQADLTLDIDTTDQERMLKAARKLQINGVIAPCTDVAVPTAALLAQELGLSGPTPQAARVLASKIRFRLFQRDHEFPTPPFAVLPEASADAFAIVTKCTCVIKPEGSSGSKGIFIVHDEAELRSRLPQTLAFSRTKEAVVEQFLSGQQGTIEGILKNGKLNPVLLTDRLTPPAPFVTTLGHIVPASIPATAQARACDQVERVCTLLDIKDGPIDCDFVWSNGEIYLIEMSPRLGGNSLIRLWQTARDIDYVDYAVSHACGIPDALPTDPPLFPTAILLLGVWRSGRLKYDEAALASLRAEPWVKAIDLDTTVGAKVEPFINGRYRIGEALIEAADRAELDRHVHQFHDRLKLEAV